VGVLHQLINFLLSSPASILSRSFLRPLSLLAHPAFASFQPLPVSTLSTHSCFCPLAACLLAFAVMHMHTASITRSTNATTVPAVRRRHTIATPRFAQLDALTFRLCPIMSDREAVKVGLACHTGTPLASPPLNPPCRFLQVIVRCRPLSDKEIRDGRQPVVLVEAGQVSVSFRSLHTLYRLLSATDVTGRHADSKRHRGSKVLHL
jgi:hypothetical protein